MPNTTPPPILVVVGGGSGLGVKNHFGFVMLSEMNYD